MNVERWDTCEFSLNGGDLVVTLTNGDYSATQLDPRTGEENDLGTVSGGEQTVVLEGKEQVLLIRRS